MKTSYLFLIALLWTSLLSAQNHIPHSCGFDHAIQHAEQYDSTYRIRYNKLFEEAKQRVRNHSFGRFNYTIPLVIHVFW